MRLRERGRVEILTAGLLAMVAATLTGLLAPFLISQEISEDLPEFTIKEQVEGQISLEFERRIEDRDRVLAIEVSDDMLSWFTIQREDFIAFESVDLPSGEGQRVTVTIAQPEGLEARFFRLKMIQASVSEFVLQGHYMEHAINIDSETDLEFSGIFHDLRTFLSTTLLSVTNTSGSAISIPIRVVVESISDPGVTVANAEGVTEEGKPFFDFSGQVESGTLEPGETSASRPISFNNPGFAQFAVIVSVEGWETEMGYVELTLTTEGNHSVIMEKETAPALGLPEGVGEELIVEVTDTTAATSVDLSQVQTTGGKGQIFFGEAGTATIATVVTSGGTPNEARIAVRHAITSGFKGDIKIEASISGTVEAEKFVTAIAATILPRCVYVSDQEPVKQTLSMVPGFAGVQFEDETFLVNGEFFSPSQSSVSSGWSATSEKGVAERLVRRIGCEAYFVTATSPIQTFASLVRRTRLEADTKTCRSSDPPGDTDSENSGGGSTAGSCPNADRSDAPKSVDLSSGEEVLVAHDLAILGRGIDYIFRRTYIGTNSRANTINRKDFGENWAYTQGESFLGRKWLIGKKIKKELDKPEGISHAKMV